MYASIPEDGAKVFEYAVLVTSLPDEVLTVAQLYRDRATGENNFDELKNHWGWGGFTTRDLQRCRLMARIVALIYNWWSLFVRLADPDQHTEAITVGRCCCTASAGRPGMPIRPRSPLPARTARPAMFAECWPRS